MAIPVAHIYKDERLRNILFLLALNFAVTPFGSITHAWLARELRFGSMAVIQFSNTAANATVSIGLAWSGWGAVSLAWGNLAAAVVSALVATFFRPSSLPWLPGFTEIRRVLSFGARISLAWLADTAAKSAPDFFLGALQNLTAAGYYSRASGLLSLFNRLVSDVAGAVVTSDFAKQSRESRDTRAPFVLALTYVCTLCWAFAGFICFMAGPVVRLLYGEQWAASTPLVGWLAGALAVGSPMYLCLAALTGLGAATSILRAGLLSAVTISCLALLGAFFSMQGVAVGILVANVFGVAGHLTKGFPSRFGAEVNQLQSINMDMFGRQVNPCWNRFSDDPHIRAACHIGMADKPAEFVLLGDSHAGALLREIDDAAKTIGVAGLSYTFRSCPPVKGIELVKSGALDQICSGIRKSFFENLAVDNVVPHTLVVAARWSLLLSGKWFDNGEGGVEEGEDWLWDVDARGGNYPEKMKSVMLDSIEIMLRSGRRVILVYPVPEMGWQVPFQLAKSYAIANGLSPESGSTSYRRYLERNRMAIEALDGLGERSNLIRIRPDRVLCDSFVKDRCVAHLEDHPLYFDDDHLSNAGARMVVAEIVKVMAH
ncbi:hypothetical protein OSTOST_13211 [Ostertagia ostertagi]